MAAPKSKRGRKPLVEGLGPSIQVTYRIPRRLYDKLDKIAESLFQPMPVILRAAAAEYAKNHRPVRWPNTGIHFKWPQDRDQPIEQTLAEVMQPDEQQTQATEEPQGRLSDVQTSQDERSEGREESSHQGGPEGQDQTGIGIEPNIPAEHPDTQSDTPVSDSEEKS